MAGHSAVVDSACPAGPAGVVNLAADIPAAESRFAGSKTAVESCVCHRGWCLGRQEGDRWVVGRGFGVAFVWGCVCAEGEMEEHRSQDPC